ncbi:MAG: hypothetical protein DSO07_12610, partial [Thermoproteota archaeon]
MLGYLTDLLGIFIPLLIISVLSLIRIPILLILRETLKSRARSSLHIKESFAARIKELKVALSRPELRAFIGMEIIGGLFFFSAFMPGYFSDVMKLNKTVIGLAFSLFMIAQAL